jgi:hypothetical protein
MWGWFAPACPLDLAEKTWTERRMRWLADQFGIDRLREAPVVLPTDDFFPDPYDATAAAAGRMMTRVCGYMGVDPRTVGFEVVPGLDQAVGHYVATDNKPVIRVVESQLEQPDFLVATLAHEVAHELLLGAGRIARDCPDHEQVTDLLPVFLGLGVFAANATVRDSSRSTALTWSWSISRQGYLPSRIFGYALALFAFLRGETSPPWVSYLRPDASEPCRSGLHFLRKTGDTLFHPDTVRDRSREASTRELAERLRHRSPTFRLDALWEVRDRQLTDAELVAPVTGLLGDDDEILVGEAAAVVSRFGPAADDAVPLLIKALAARRDETRVNATVALGALHLRPEDAVGELSFLLKDDNYGVRGAAREALRQFGVAAESATEKLLDSTRSWTGGCSFDEDVALTLLAISADPDKAVREHFMDDEERCQQVLETLNAARRS